MQLYQVELLVFNIIKDNALSHLSVYRSLNNQLHDLPLVNFEKEIRRQTLNIVSDILMILLFYYPIF